MTWKLCHSQTWKDKGAKKTTVTSSAGPCDKMGHYAIDCPSKPADKNSGGSAKAIDGSLMLVMGEEGSGEDDYDSVDELSFHQGDMCVKPKWIILDNQSTADILCNSELLSIATPAPATLPR
jgi:hypothetical protein